MQCVQLIIIEASLDLLLRRELEIDNLHAITHNAQAKYDQPLVHLVARVEPLVLVAPCRFAPQTGPSILKCRRPQRVF